MPYCQPRALISGSYIVIFHRERYDTCCERFQTMGDVMRGLITYKDRRHINAGRNTATRAPSLVVSLVWVRPLDLLAYIPQQVNGPARGILKQ